MTALCTNKALQNTLEEFHFTCMLPPGFHHMCWQFIFFANHLCILSALGRLVYFQGVLKRSRATNFHSTSQRKIPILLVAYKLQPHCKAAEVPSLELQVGKLK